MVFPLQKPRRLNLHSSIEMLKRLFAIAVIGVAGECLENRIVGARRQLQHVVIKQGKR
jgi:hypothetical protein